MIKGIGTDIVEIDRIRRLHKTYGEYFLGMFFTESERDYCMKRVDPVPHLTARICVKEAFMKAIGKGIYDGIRWKDVELVSDGRRPPSLVVSRRISKFTRGLRFHVSISHSKTVAVATVICEKR